MDVFFFFKWELWFVCFVEVFVVKCLLWGVWFWWFVVGVSWCLCVGCDCCVFVL